MTTRLLIWSYESVIFAEPGDNAGHGILSEIIQCETQYLVCDILIAASCGGGHRDAAARNLEPSPAQPSPAQPSPGRKSIWGGWVALQAACSTHHCRQGLISFDDGRGGENISAIFLQIFFQEGVEWHLETLVHCNIIYGISLSEIKFRLESSAAIQSGNLCLNTNTNTYRSYRLANTSVEFL